MPRSEVHSLVFGEVGKDHIPHLLYIVSLTIRSYAMLEILLVIKPMHIEMLIFFSK